MSIKIFIISTLLLFSHFCLSQNQLHLSVLNKLNIPIQYVNVYETGYSMKGTTSDENGKILLNYFDQNNYLIISCIGYQTIEIKIKEIENRKKIILQENNFLLNEVIIKNKNDFIPNLLKKIKGNFNENYVQSPNLKVIGEHKVNLENKLFLSLKGKFQLNFKSIKESDYIQIVKNEETYIIKPQTEVTIPYYFNIYLSNQFKSLNIPSLPFISKPKNFNYIVSEDNDSTCKIIFSPKKSDKGQYEGYFTLNLTNYAITNLYCSLVYNNNNVQKVIIPNKIKYNVLYYYEKSNFDLTFEKSGSEKYILKHLSLNEKMNRYIGKENERKMYEVYTNLAFEEAVTKEKTESKSLYDELFVAAPKNR